MKINTILMLGSFGSGAIENFYKQGFEKCGLQVDTYGIADQYYAALSKSIINKVINKVSADVFYRDINTGLLRFLQKKRYDMILVFKGMELFPETVMQLKEHAVLTANYNGDHPFIFYSPASGNRHVRNSIPHYDVHFSYAQTIVQQLRQRFNKQAFCIPFGYNSSVQAVSGNPAGAYAGRFLFIGAFDHERARYLNQLQSDRLHIYGDASWKLRNMFRPYIRKVYQHRALYGKDYAEAIVSATGILNLLRKQNIAEDSHNMRTFEVPGYGGLLVSQRTGGQLEYFEEDKEAVFFGSPGELKEKMAYLSAHPAVVNSMKQAAHTRSVRADYSYDQRSRQLLACLENIL